MGESVNLDGENLADDSKICRFGIGTYNAGEDENFSDNIPVESGRSREGMGESVNLEEVKEEIRDDEEWNPELYSAAIQVISEVIPKEMDSLGVSFQPENSGALGCFPMASCQGGSKESTSSSFLSVEGLMVRTVYIFELSLS